MASGTQEGEEMSEYVFHVNFQKDDGSRYSLRRFKSFYGARNYIRRNKLLHIMRGYTAWAISRECQADWARTCVLAQSVGFTAKTWFRNRSDADKWTAEAKK